MYQLSEAPFRGQPMRTQQRDHYLAHVQSVVERPLPVRPADDPVVRVAVEKDTMTGLFEKVLENRGTIDIPAAMAQEDGAHGVIPCSTGGLVSRFFCRSS